MGSDFNGTYFSDLRIRPALHDLESNDAGYSDGLGISFMDGILRADMTNKKLFIQNFHLLEIMSLPAVIPNIHFLSWHLDLGFEKGFGEGEYQDKNRGYLLGGMGYSWYAFQNKFLFYSLFQGDIGYGQDYGFHLGPTVSFGSLYRISKNFKIILRSQFSERTNFKETISSQNLSATLATYFSKNVESRLIYQYKNKNDEMIFALQYYF